MAYVATQLRTSAERRMVDHDPNSTAEVLVVLDPANAMPCVPLADNAWRRMIAGVFRSVGSGAVTAFRIIAATSVAGAGATTVVTHPFPELADTVGHTLWLEFTLEQILEALPGATHLGIGLTLATGTDECVVYLERQEPRFQTGDLLTTDYISA